MTPRAAALDELLTTAAVAARYGVTAKTARRLMREAGAFKVVGRLVVRAADLAAYEQRQLDEQTPPEPVPAVPPQRPRRGDDALPPGFWREP